MLGIMRQTAFLFVFPFLALGVAFSPASPLADDAYLGKARRFIADLSRETLDNLAAGNVEKVKRVSRFAILFEKHFAVKSIAKWVLGRHWRGATDAEKTEYLGLFDDLMVLTYVDRFANYSGWGLKVVKAIQEREHSATVFSEIALPNGNGPVRVDWRLASKGDVFKIVDVVVEGASMSQTLRSDFNSTIKREGGTVSGLLKALRAKAEGLKKPRAG